MKALTVRFPWAAYIADGSKMIETRSFRTSHRGPLLICSGHEIDEAAMSRADVPKSWAFGVALCIVHVEDCRPMSIDDEPLALVAYHSARFSWVLTRRTVIARPFPVRGMPGIFDVQIPNGLEVIHGRS